jgi:hypothetical protein
MLKRNSRSFPPPRLDWLHMQYVLHIYLYGSVDFIKTLIELFNIAWES